MNRIKQRNKGLQFNNLSIIQISKKMEVPREAILGGNFDKEGHYAKITSEKDEEKPHQARYSTYALDLTTTFCFSNFYEIILLSKSTQYVEANLLSQGDPTCNKLCLAPILVNQPFFRRILNVSQNSYNCIPINITRGAKKSTHYTSNNRYIQFSHCVNIARVS